MPWRPSTSTSRVRRPCPASASARAAATAVLPGPPLPDTTCSRPPSQSVSRLPMAARVTTRLGHCARQGTAGASRLVSRPVTDDHRTHRPMSTARLVLVPQSLPVARALLAGEDSGLLLGEGYPHAD